MRDCFARLRHYAIIGGHDQHHNVCCLGAARAHGGEGGVAGRIQKSNLLVVVNCLVCANVLGDAAGFTTGNICFADRIKQRSLAMVHMP